MSSLSPFSRTVAAATLAFAGAIAGTPDTQAQTRQVAPGVEIIKVPNSERNLDVCLRDHHVFRLETHVNALDRLVNTNPSSIPVKSFLDGVETSMDVLKQYSSAQVSSDPKPLADTTKAIQAYGTLFRNSTKIPVELAINGYAISDKPTAACVAQAAATAHAAPTSAAATVMARMPN